VVTEYYQHAGSSRNQTLELDLPDSEEVSGPVLEALMNERLVQVADLKTLNDFKLLQIGWIYDVNFPRTFQIVRENRYLEMILDALPQNSSRIAQIYDRARAYLERNSPAGHPAPPG